MGCTRIIVCGYGLVGSKYRHGEELAGLIMYYNTLENLIMSEKYLNLNQQIVEKGYYYKPKASLQVIFTGGKTNKKWCNLTESETAQTYFLEICNWTLLQTLETSVEKTSITTAQNIAYGYGKSRGSDNGRVVIVCDHYRSFKVRLFSLILLGRWVGVSPLPRPDTSWKSNFWYQSTLGLLKELFSLKFWKLWVWLRFN